MKIFRFIIPLAVLAGCGWYAKKMIDSRPPPQRFSAPRNLTHVEATRLSPTNYQIWLQCQGTVRPRTESTLIPEVSGLVTKISPNFRDGGFFEKGEVLVLVDSSDYESALTVARAVLTEATTNLELEQAQSEQALEDWKKLGEGGEPSPLVLRKPQLAKAEASVESARARLEEAQRNLQRVSIAAPYAGRIMTKRVDVGQYVSPGSVLANIYAVDYAEIRLPLSNDQLAYVDIPEVYRGDAPSDIPPGPEVIFKSRVGEAAASWKGRVVQAEGAMDTRSRQLFVVAQVENPYGRTANGRPPLKVGMFVQAEIRGRMMTNVFVLPRSTVRPGDEVLIIDDKNCLHRRPLEIIQRDSRSVIVAAGLKTGEVLCQTPLPFAAEGSQVVPKIDGAPPRMVEGQGPPGGKKGGGSGSGNAGKKGPPGGDNKGEASKKSGGKPGAGNKKGEAR